MLKNYNTAKKPGMCLSMSDTSKEQINELIQQTTLPVHQNDDDNNNVTCITKIHYGCKCATLDTEYKMCKTNNRFQTRKSKYRQQPSKEVGVVD